MPIEQTDKLDSSMPASAAGTGAVRPQRHPRAAVWPFDTGASEDTFATPSQSPTGEVDPESLVGPEPAVFGGTQPGATELDENGQPIANQASDGSDTSSEPLGTTLDESVRGNELLGDAPKINYARIAKSTPFLLGSLIASLIAAWWFVRMAVPTETYVQTSVHFNNYTKLNEVEVPELQTEINKLLRTYPLRATAWATLQKRSPDIKPGFLNSGLIFHRLDAITWDAAGTVYLRIASDDPASDLTRLSALTEAFYGQLADRATHLDEYRKLLKEQQVLYASLLKQDVELKAKIDELLPEAQRYMDLKQAMQAMERYLELTDESNPLRLVARQNLARLTRQVNDAREKSLKRDELLSQRVEHLRKIETSAAEVIRLKRAIDVFVYPDPFDMKTLLIHDTRPHQKLIMRSAWIALIAVFGGIFAAIHWLEARAAERARRERREFLKAQAAAAKP